MLVSNKMAEMGSLSFSDKDEPLLLEEDSAASIEGDNLAFFSFWLDEVSLDLDLRAILPKEWLGILPVCHCGEEECIGELANVKNNEEQDSENEDSTTPLAVSSSSYEGMQHASSNPQTNQTQTEDTAEVGKPRPK